MKLTKIFILLLTGFLLTWAVGNESRKPLMASKTKKAMRKAPVKAQKDVQQGPLSSVVTSKWMDDRWENFQEIEYLYGSSEVDTSGSGHTIIHNKVVYSDWNSDDQRWIKQRLVELRLHDWDGRFLPSVDTVYAIYSVGSDTGWQLSAKLTGDIDDGNFYNGTVINSRDGGEWKDSIQLSITLDAKGNRVGYSQLELVDNNWQPTVSYKLTVSVLNPEYTEEYSVWDGVATMPTHRIIHWFTSPGFADADGFFIAEHDSLTYYQVYRDSQWVDSSKTESTFDGEGMPLTTTVSQFMDSVWVDSMWTDSVLVDSLLVDGVMEDSILVDSVLMDSVWVDSAQTASVLRENVWVVKTHKVYTYNEAGEIKEEITQMIDSLGDSTNYERTVYYRDPNFVNVAPVLSELTPIKFTQTHQGVSISYLSQTAGDAQIGVYNVKGNLVYKINSSTTQNRNFQWNYLGKNNRKVEAGVYYIKATIGNHTKQQKFFVK